MTIPQKGRGKSSGMRIITFTAIVAVDETETNQLCIYRSNGKTVRQHIRLCKQQMDAFRSSMCS